MPTKSGLSKLLGLGVILLPLQSFAAAATDTATELSKDEWLGKLKTVAPEVICKGFLEEESLKKRFQELSIDNAKCMSLIPPSFDKCQTQYYSSLPATLNRESASKWGHTIGECIGSDFATKYLIDNATPSSSGTPNSTDNSTPPPPSTSSDMSKDTWLKQLKTLAPSMICKGFLEEPSLQKKFEERKIDNAKCLTLIPPSFDKCQTQFYSSLPATLNQDTASTWGHKIGECIGTDFAKQYLTEPTTP